MQYILNKKFAQVGVQKGRVSEGKNCAKWAEETLRAIDTKGLRGCSRYKKENNFYYNKYVQVQF